MQANQQNSNDGMDPNLRESLLRKRSRILLAKQALDQLLEPVQPSDKSRKYRPEDPEVSNLEHYSLSQFSVAEGRKQMKEIGRSRSQRVSEPLENPSASYLSKGRMKKIIKGGQVEEELKERAREFIRRITKQKEYIDGKSFLKKQRYEQKRKKQEELQQHNRQQLILQELERRRQRAKDNLELFREKAEYRLSESIRIEMQRHSRCKTHNEEYEGVKGQQKVKGLPKLGSRCHTYEKIEEEKERSEPVRFFASKDSVRRCVLKVKLNTNQTERKSNPLVMSLRKRLAHLQKLIATTETIECVQS